jgi:hypothetical protein
MSLLMDMCLTCLGDQGINIWEVLISFHISLNITKPCANYTWETSRAHLLFV